MSFVTLANFSYHENEFLYPLKFLLCFFFFFLNLFFFLLSWFLLFISLCLLFLLWQMSLSSLRNNTLCTSPQEQTSLQHIVYIFSAHNQSACWDIIMFHQPMSNHFYIYCWIRLTLYASDFSSTAYLNILFKLVVLEICNSGDFILCPEYDLIFSACIKCIQNFF